MFCDRQLSVFTILMERGASSEAKTQYGETPLGKYLLSKLDLE